MSWIANGALSYLYTQQAREITLERSTFSKPLHYPGDNVPGGVVLGRVTATGRYGPYDPEAEDGREVAKGFLLSGAYFGPHPAHSGQPAPTATATLLLAGFIHPAELPANNGLDAAARTALRHIAFLDV
ncbi:head decoration protein [Nocardia sp. NPDC058176]|uniref:head decoration protein n=1 Tax=Nocardia sp. NPDC058176 TaxID=3346368 RepID=UPI0036DF286B